MHRHVITGTAVLVLAAGTAQAQGIEGGTVSLNYFESENGSTWDGTHMAGSLEFGVGANLSIQGDLTVSNESGSSDATSIGVHGIYELSPGTKAGVFLAQEDWDGSTGDVSGLEIATGLGGGTRIEGFLATYSFGSSDFDALGVGASFPVGSNIELLGGLTLVSGDWDVTILQGGARYRIDGGFYGQLALATASADEGGDYDSISLEVGLDFGEGAAFNSRAFLDLFPGG